VGFKRNKKRTTVRTANRTKVRSAGSSSIGETAGRNDDGSVKRGEVGRRDSGRRKTAGSERSAAADRGSAGHRDGQRPGPGNRAAGPKGRFAKNSQSESPVAGFAPIRLQRYLAQAGIASRRRAEEVIAAGRVAINGQTVTKPGTIIDPLKDRVSVDGKLLRRQVRRLFLLHKPRGVVSTMNDPQGRPTIADYTKSIDVRLYPVGRLDFDVSGLVVLTNDGDLAHKLMHPKFESRRIYWARVSGRPASEDLVKLTNGVEIEGKRAVALAVRPLRASAQADSVLGRDRSGVTSALIELEVGEGRKHLVKELFKTIGFPVLQLARIKHGEYNLGDLKPGEIREIQAERDSAPRTRRDAVSRGGAKSPRRGRAASGEAPKRYSAAARDNGDTSPKAKNNPRSFKRRGPRS
jgi:23S rRNA pseudouridine2605 synthase